MSHYKPYPEYKESGIEWIGKVPEHWNLIPIKRLTKLNTVRMSDTTEGMTYIGLEDVESESGKYSPTDGNSRQSDSSTVGVFSKGQVLYGKLRPYLKKSIIADFDGVCSTEFLVLQPERVLPELLHRWFLTSDVTQQIEATCEGAKMPRADWESIGNISMPLPPKQEQLKIRESIQFETNRIDTLITKKTRFIELLKEKRQALITHAVTKGLDPDAPMKDSGIVWIGEIPEHWDMKRLRHIANFKNSNVDKKSYDDQESVKLCNYTDVYYNEIITPDMNFMVATASESEIESFSLKKGDVIITKDSEDPKDIGIPALVLEDMDDVVCGYHLTVINTYEPNMSEFVYRSIQAHSTKAHFFVESPGITRYGLDQDAIGDIPVCVPPEEERLSIIDRINWEVIRIDTIITKTQRSIELLKERRSAFITAAVTGQIDLREEVQ